MVLVYEALKSESAEVLSTRRPGRRAVAASVNNYQARPRPIHLM